MNKVLDKLLVALVAGGVLVACSSTKAPEKSKEEEVVASAPVVEEASAPVVEEASAPQVAPKIMNHNAVYFAFDKYNIVNNYDGIIKANSDYLMSNSDAKVQVQGNTDDIGSVEYNLALGQRRANAVKNALVAGGVSKRQIEAVSNGKLKPKYPNDTDDGRAKNRRSDIMYKMNEPKGYTMSSDSLPMVDDSFYNGQEVQEGIQ